MNFLFKRQVSSLKWISFYCIHDCISYHLLSYTFQQERKDPFLPKLPDDEEEEEEEERKLTGRSLLGRLPAVAGRTGGRWKRYRVVTGSRRSRTSPAVAARVGGPGGHRQQLPMYAGSRGSVRRPPCLHCGDHLQHAPLPTSQPRRLGLHHQPQDDAWRRSPSRGLLSPSLGSLAVARPAAGMSSTMAARWRKSRRCSLVCGCCTVTGRRGCRGGRLGQRPCRQQEILGLVCGGAGSVEIHDGGRLDRRKSSGDGN
jgi:hypothetical protein